MKTFYITTAIHYVNDLPHIGHIYENVTADVIARFHRMIGEDVWFLTGTDEHGVKIERSAARLGVPPIELADRVVEDHKRLGRILALSNDDFIRTTESRHHAGVYEIIKRMQEKNPDDIVLGDHSGWYCQTEEAFFPESQVTGGKCENGHPVEWTTERNYFFRLSRYREPLLEHYRSHPEFVKPQTRFNEVIAFVEAGLKDLSISRTSITWGIPFPGNHEHVIYVWLDALTNYISALGFGSADDERFRKYWPAQVHLIGKDITRFHAIYWPAFLMSAGLPLPQSIVSHGFWLRDNQKISKSLGNIVRPDDVISEFGADPFRYYLMREMTFGHDANYSDEAFLTRYNSDLANDLGNTLSRAVKMSDSYFGGKTPPTPCDDNDLRNASIALVPDYISAMEQFNFQRAIEVVWKLLVAVNGYIVTREPWKHFKEKGADEGLARVIWSTLEAQRIVWTMLSPIMPRLSLEALRRLGAGAQTPSRDALAWGGLPNGVAIVVADALFPRIDARQYLATEPNQETKVSEANEPQQPAGESKPAEQKTTPPLETTAAMPPDALRISIDEFFRADLRVAEIVAAEKVEKSKKLMKLRVSTGDAERTVVAGIATKYTAEELVGRKVVIVANLQPAKLMGIESNGMVLAASIDGEPSLLSVDPSVPAGTKVK
jgi:methionyl-tRNA synthetase